MPYTKLQSTIQQKARKKYVTAKEIAEQYSISDKQVYRLVQKYPELQETVVKFGTKKAERFDIDRFFEICQQLFR